MASQLALFGAKKKAAKKRRPRAKPASSWALFTKRNMSAFMKSYGSHAAAMRALGVAWRKQAPAKKKTAKKRCKSRVSVKGHSRKCPAKKRRR